jgi:hypothetical protein
LDHCTMAWKPRFCLLHLTSFILITAALKYNLYTLNFTCFKFKMVCKKFKSCAAITTSHFKIVPSLLKFPLCPFIWEAFGLIFFF